MSQKNIVCYASQLGDCSNIQSYEHYISQGIFTNNMLTIEGQSWLKGQSKTISMKKLGLPILCHKHNNELSPVDTFAKGFVTKIDRLFQATLERSNLKRSSLLPKIVYDIDARMLERWMIKCAVGVMFENKDLHWHPDGAPAEMPPLNILRTLYGMEALKSPMGLYLTMAVGTRFENLEISGAAHLQHPKTGGYIGAVINLRNYKFLIWLSDEEVGGYIFPAYQSFPREPEYLFGPGHNEPIYHPRELKFTGKGKVVGSINLNWNDET